MFERDALTEQVAAAPRQRQRFAGSLLGSGRFDPDAQNALLWILQCAAVLDRVAQRDSKSAAARACVLHGGVEIAAARDLRVRQARTGRARSSSG